jgi:hypothetical protein
MKLYSASLARKYKLPLAIILVGILFSLYLQLQIPGEVFFSGDAGPKMLLTKQFASGNFKVDLDLPVESWVRNLWASGLYPFEPPFAYNIDNRFYIQYPFPFPLISAPFYALLGWRGLYIIPLISTWIIWWRFYIVCKHLRIGIISTSLGLASLILASPLTLYSAMFWEHTIAVVLAFYGLSIILILPTKELPTSKAILSGVLVGLSVWFRQELVLVVLAICVLFLAARKLNFSFQKKSIFLISMLLTVALFLVLNTIAYNHPLGIYALPLGLKSAPAGQELKNFNFGVEGSQSYGRFERIARVVIVFVKLNARLLLYLPISLFTAFYILLVLVLKKIKLNSYVNFLLLICLSISFAVPLIGWEGAKEWGPRYLLISIPIITLSGTIALNYLMKIRNYKLRNLSIVIFISSLVSGTYVNTYLGTIHLSRDYYQRVLPALNFLQANQNKVVAVSSQYISQELVAAFDDKEFFLTKTNDDLERLSSVLMDKGYQKFLYVVAQSHKEKVDFLEFTSGDKVSAIKFSKLGTFGTYVLYEASIVEPSGITGLKP